MDLKLNGKTALVTAASYGLGFACAKELAAEGVRVVICSRDGDRVNKAAEQITQETGGQVTGIEADLRKQSDVQQLLGSAEAVLGGIDILVLSTGHPPTFPFTKATDDHWEEGIDLVLRPAVSLTRGVLPGMRVRRYGRLIYIGSATGLQPEKSTVVQSTLRTGMNAFSKCIATEAAADGVTANVICPGYFDTPLVTNLAGKYAEEEGVSTEQVLDNWKNLSPAAKFGKPEDLGAFVAFLASPRGEFFNGTSIAMDGGYLKQY